MSDMAPTGTTLRIADLSPTRPNRFALLPDAPARTALAASLGVETLRKVRFEGAVLADGAQGWRLEARLGATVVQACVVTLEPVTTRIDDTVLRRFLPADQIDQPDPGSEVEMPQDDTLDVLPETLDLTALMTEALALALPDYPRKDGADLGAATYAEDGIAPMTDEEVRPFAALKGLRDKLADED